MDAAFKKLDKAVASPQWINIYRDACGKFADNWIRSWINPFVDRSLA